MTSKEDQAHIAAFVQNKLMFEAVRNVLLQGMIGDNFTSRNWVANVDRKLSDTAFGKEVKIKLAALEWINGGFQDLQRIGGAGNPQPPGVNEAR